MGTPYDPTPPPLSPGELKEIEQLLTKSDSIALQFRFHIPSDEPERIWNEFRTHAEASDRARGDKFCAGQKIEFCMAGGRGLLVGRTDGKAAVIDMLLFTTRFADEANVEAWRGVMTEASTAPQAEQDELSKMAGHASLYIDAEALVDLFEHERVGSAVRSLSWESEEPRRAIDRRLREGEALRRMLAAPRLYRGLLANMHHQRERTQLQVTWPLREDQRELATKSLALPALRVPVPTIDALCDGALACARSRGFPSPETLGTSLGLGVYGDIRALDDALDDADEMAALLIFVSTWPNALGSLTWHLPLSEMGRGPEAAFMRGGLGALARIQGLGVSLRSLDVGRRSVQASYAAYARAPASDISLVNTGLAFAEMHMSPTTIEGVEGKVMMIESPDDDVPAILMTYEDDEAVPGDDGKDVRHAWLAVVDDKKRMKWLMEAPTDEGTEPFVYMEIPDLWRMVAVVPELVDELGFARTWATERAFKTSMTLDDGAVQIVMDLAETPQDAKKSEK